MAAVVLGLLLGMRVSIDRRSVVAGGAGVRGAGVRRAGVVTPAPIVQI
ncbi:hypothetical protein ATKI12_6123 [Kitasatospora sp. Ki12]